MGASISLVCPKCDLATNMDMPAVSDGVCRHCHYIAPYNEFLSSLCVAPHKQRNVGASDYSKHTIQPWDIWREYKLNPWDADIIKRVLRTKEGDSRKLDYQKIMHICEERIAQLDGAYDETTNTI